MPLHSGAAEWGARSSVRSVLARLSLSVGSQVSYLTPPSLSFLLCDRAPKSCPSPGLMTGTHLESIRHARGTSGKAQSIQMCEPSKRAPGKPFDVQKYTFQVLFK